MQITILSILITALIHTYGNLKIYKQIADEGFKCDLHKYQSYKNTKLDQYVLNTPYFKQLLDFIKYILPGINIFEALKDVQQKLKNELNYLMLNSLLKEMSYEEVITYNQLKGFFKKVEYSTKISYDYVDHTYKPDNIVMYVDKIENPEVCSEPSIKYIESSNDKPKVRVRKN
ncbi:MAG: hypothetical protein R3Y13_02775 [bacterium]